MEGYALNWVTFEDLARVMNLMYPSRVESERKIQNAVNNCNNMTVVMK